MLTLRLAWEWIFAPIESVITLIYCRRLLESFVRIQSRQTALSLPKLDWVFFESYTDDGHYSSLASAAQLSSILLLIVAPSFIVFSNIYNCFLYRIQRELAEITLEPPPNCRYILSETRRQSFIFGIKKNKQNNRNAVFVALNRTFCKTAIKISDEAKAAQNCT